LAAQANAPAQAQSNTQIMGALAAAFPQEFARGAFNKIFAKPTQPTTFQRDFNFLTTPTAQGGQGMTPETALKTLKKGTTVNVGQDKILSVGDLNKLQRPEGGSFPVGTTVAQAAAGGAVPVTAEQQKTNAAIENFTGIFDEIEALAIGEGGIFNEIEPGFASRAGAALRFGIDALTGEDPKVEQFEALTQGTLSALAKLLGEKGALAEGDVQRVANLLPQVRDEFMLPDTRESAVRKLGQVRGILNRGVKRAKGLLQSGPRRSLLPRARRKRSSPQVINFGDLPV